MCQYVREQIKPLQHEIDRLERRLAAANAEVKKLRKGKADRPVRWHVDCSRNYKCTAFYQNGQPGPALDLYPLFARFFVEAGLPGDG